VDKSIPEHWERRMSRISAVCHKIHLLITSGSTSSNSECEDFVMQPVRADVYHGQKDNEVAQFHWNSRQKNMAAPGMTEGPQGQEVRYFGVRTFPSGSIVGLFGVWPGQATDVYAIAVDEKFPEFFGLYYRSCHDPKHAKQALAGLESFERKRNEELGAALVESGWCQLVPLSKARSRDRPSVPPPSLHIAEPPERSITMSSQQDLRRVISDINCMVHAAASSGSRLEDSVLRRTLAFLSQVILVVEQAFQDVLTLLVDIEFLDESTLRPNDLLELRKRVEMLVARSHYRDAAEICSRLKHLRGNYDSFIRKAVEKLPEFSSWQGLLGLIEEREGRIIQLVERTAGDLAQLLAKAEGGNLNPLKDYASRQISELRAMLSELHSLNGRILGLSGDAGFLELTRDRNSLEREVNIHVDQRDQSTTHGHRVTVDHSSTFSGDLVMANSISDSFKKAGDAPSSQLQSQLERLCQHVESLIRDLPKDTAAQIAQDLSTFVSEASKAQPRRKWYELSGEGLIDAAKACAGMASPVIKTVKSILALLGPLGI
jgi:hypothetical protein